MITKEEFDKWEKSILERIQNTPEGIRRDNLVALYKEAKWNFTIGRKMEFNILKLK